MRVNGSFHGPAASRWALALERCQHDMYHLPAFASLEAAWEGAYPQAFIVEDAEGTMLLPLLLRPTPAGTGLDAVTPYGYSGPAFSHDCTLGFRSQALAAFDAAARDRGLVSTFMRLHPLLETSLAPVLVDAGLPWREVAHGETVTLPLGPGPEEWLSALGKNLRYDIRRLRRLGYTFELDTEACWAAFPPMYQDTMERIGTGDRYHYSAGYLKGFREALGGNVHCAMVRAPDGDPAAAGLFSRVGPTVQYHLSGTQGRYQKDGPTKLLLAEMREHARSTDAEVFHLGGGEGSSRNSLFSFKARFGGDTRTFRSLRAVHNPDAFRKECRAWLDRTGADALDEEGFFPPYRAQAPKAVPPG